MYQCLFTLSDHVRQQQLINTSYLLPHLWSIVLQFICIYHLVYPIIHHIVNLINVLLPSMGHCVPENVVVIIFVYHLGNKLLIYDLFSNQDENLYSETFSVELLIHNYVVRVYDSLVLDNNLALITLSKILAGSFIYKTNIEVKSTIWLDTQLAIMSLQTIAIYMMANKLI